MKDLRVEDDETSKMRSPRTRISYSKLGSAVINYERPGRKRNANFVMAYHLLRNSGSPEFGHNGPGSVQNSYLVMAY